MQLRNSKTKNQQEKNNKILKFEVKQNLITITARSNNRTYQATKILDPDLDVQDLKRDLLAQKFKILAKTHQNIKVKVGFLSFEFVNIKSVQAHSSEINSEKQQSSLTQKVQSLTIKVEQIKESTSNLVSSMNQIISSMNILMSRFPGNQNLHINNNQNQCKSRNQIYKVTSKIQSLSKQKNSEGNIILQNKQKIQQKIQQNSSRLIKQKNQSIGFARFKMGVTKKHRAYLIGNEKRKIFNQSNWAIHIQQNQYQDWKQLFYCLSRISCTQLDILNHQAQYQSVLHTILAVPYYTNLIQLDISVSSLTSIESLGFMKSLSIQKIIVRRNSLTIAKAFSRFYSRGLRYLSFHQNPINEIELGRIKFSQIQFPNPSIGMIRDISKLFKVQQKNRSQKIQISFTQRIMQRASVQALSRVYPQIRDAQNFSDQ